MTQPLSSHRYDTIAGLEGREPVDAVLTVGRKGPSGAPTETDRFFIKTRYEEQKGNLKFRPEHPGFKSFNATKNPDGSDADKDKRRVVTGNLVHESMADCFSHSLANPKAPKGGRWPNHPSGKPFCTGDGTRATRLYAIGEDGSEDWREIACPNDKCEFRQGDAKLCKAFARLYFRPSWPDGVKLPTPLMKYETHGWETAANMLGFFEYVEGIAKGLGLDTYTLFGMPFTLTLARKTNALKKTAFPVVSMAPTFDPVSFFMEQRKNRELAGGRPLLQIVGAASPEENGDEAIAASMRELSGETPRVPAETPPPPITDAVYVDAESLAPLEPPHVLKILAAGHALGLTEEQIDAHIGAKARTCIPEFENEALRKLKALRPQR